MRDMTSNSLGIWGKLRVNGLRIGSCQIPIWPAFQQGILVAMYGKYLKTQGRTTLKGGYCIIEIHSGSSFQLAHEIPIGAVVMTQK